MDKPLQIQKTISILNNSSNESIAVTSLPESIRNEIDTLDHFRQDHNNLLYKGEMLTLAIQLKSMQIEQLIKDNIATKTPIVDDPEGLKLIPDEISDD